MRTCISLHEAVFIKYERKSESSTLRYDNPLAAFQEFPIYNPEVGVWCAMSARKIIRIVYFIERKASPYVIVWVYCTCEGIL
jgi:hypothetical protein